MYAGNYGYPNASAPPPGQGPNMNQSSPQQQQQQQQQQMMYNSQQQSPMGPQGGGFPGGPNMVPGAGPAGVMQNPGVPHMAAGNGQSTSHPSDYKHKQP
jgi:hypothetical protein